MEGIKTVVFFGSAKSSPLSKEYVAANNLAAIFAENGVSVITGGGPGIMEAANKGAKSNGGESWGFSIRIDDQISNNFCTEGLYFECKTFQERKQKLMENANAFVIFPGGFGTLDELFEVLVHMRTRRIKVAPVILFDSTFWNGLLSWIKKELIHRNLIGYEDFNLIQLYDDIYEISKSLIVVKGERRTKLTMNLDIF